MQEREWVDKVIERFRIPHQPGAVGPGDDAAVLTPTPGSSLVLTVDTLVEGTHFRPEWLSEEELGGRAMRVSISDLAAMAARPRGALISIESPQLPGAVGEAFWNGVAATAAEFDCTILGGNVTRTAGSLSVATTLIGEVVTGREVLRSTARAGDRLWVSGCPGAAAAARELLEGGRQRLEDTRQGDETLPFRVPKPRIGLALELNERGLLRAAIDLSDGLGLDATRLLEASSAGATIEIGRLTDRLTAEQVLDGGDDYELLVALPSDFDATELGLTPLGQVEERHGLRVTRNGTPMNYQPAGWDPF